MRTLEGSMLLMPAAAYDLASGREFTSVFMFTLKLADRWNRVSLE